MQLLHANATYGKLNQAQLDLQPGLNVICAPNEGGKSTWSRFLLTMFYGLNTRQRGDLADKNRFQPWNGTPMQGRLELSAGEKLLVLSRRTQRTDAPMGVFPAPMPGRTPLSLIWMPPIAVRLSWVCRNRCISGAPLFPPAAWPLMPMPTWSGASTLSYPPVRKRSPFTGRKPPEKAAASAQV